MYIYFLNLVFINFGFVKFSLVVFTVSFDCGNQPWLQKLHKTEYGNPLTCQI